MSTLCGSLRGQRHESPWSDLRCWTALRSTVILFILRPWQEGIMVESSSMRLFIFSLRRFSIWLWGSLRTFGVPQRKIARKLRSSETRKDFKCVPKLCPAKAVCHDRFACGVTNIHFWVCFWYALRNNTRCCSSKKEKNTTTWSIWASLGVRLSRICNGKNQREDFTRYLWLREHQRNRTLAVTCQGRRRHPPRCWGLPWKIKGWF